ncbi:MAG: 1-acyl-sn-glycerol-3-phosphate acyltransferase [Actinomycetota bacterium]
MTTKVEEAGWPADAPRSGPVVVLLDASSRIEAEMLGAWVERHLPTAVEVVTFRLAPSRRRKPVWTDPGLERRLKAGDNPFVFPIRVAWSPHARGGGRAVSWWDVLKLGDPRDPDALRQRVILARWPDRVTIITGPGAEASRLVDDHHAAVEVSSLAEFATRRAWLALEKAERVLRGNRYKVPRFVHQEIWSRASFGEGATRFGALRGLDEKVALARARHYLREMAANHSPFVIDLIANLIHWIIRQGYGGIEYDRQQAAELSALGLEVPLVFLPSHRSNLDRLALQFLKWENDLPPNHTAGGINMNFFPVGPLVRGTGVFFIRRTFKGNELYRFVLRGYLDYLVENRFPLEWYLEGGRSRTGKLLPPRLGLLAYAVDSWRRGKADDLMLIPTSIVYDQIQDLTSYATEARGGGKQSESLGWALSFIRSLRRRYGKIHIRFAEPVSVAKTMAGTDFGEGSMDLAKLAFEVMYRTSAVTQITPASVVSIALLDAGGRARTLGELVEVCTELDSFIEAHRLPTTEPLSLSKPGEVRRVLTLLGEHGNVSVFQGTEEVFYLNPEQALRASYYRNVVVHHFVPRAVAELALTGLGPGLAGDYEAELFERVAAVRDLMKFEFFFPEKEAWREVVRADLDRTVPGWEQMTAAAVLSHLGYRVAQWAVVPLLESYLVVADHLAALRPGDPVEEKAVVAECMKRGEEYRLKGLVSADSVSAVVFRHCLALAANRGVLDSQAETQHARTAFADEIRSALESGRVDRSALRYV